MENSSVVIRKRGVDRIRRGHVWVYRGDIATAAGASGGDIVAVHDERGTVVGKAFYSAASQIALRFLTRGSAAIDEEFFRERFARADHLRERLGIDPMLSRRVFSEGDLLPGLIVDRYGDWLVAQSLIQATDRLQSFFTGILEDLYRPRSILFRNDSRVRALEGLDLRQETCGEPIPDSIVVFDEGKQFHVSLSSGQKTGSFLDQRLNHQVARRFARGRALDAFTYGGGFAIHISDVCDSVEAVDSSESAITLARANARMNNLTNIQCIQANAFDLLRERHSQGIRYNTIILDPPAFARNRDSLEGAIRGYKEINNRAMRLLEPGGVLITCSCSHHVSEALFAEMLAEAANDAGCWVRVLERRTQSPDHPIVLTVPETMYLKCFVLEVLY
jgi:23S rRNA (cytosine1962-C5)-methyltransferase